MLLAILNQLGLFFTQPYLIVPLTIGGFLTRDRRIFSQALLLVTFTTIYNAYLKSIWQIPLPAPLKGWAFPSGHMHSAFIFWGVLAYEHRHPWLTLAVSSMLALSGFGLVYSGYHYFIDVIGAVGFGALTLSLHALLQKKPNFHNKPSREGFLLSSLGLILTFIMPPIARKLHVWQALGTVMTYTLGWFLYEQYQDYRSGAKQKRQITPPTSDPIETQVSLTPQAKDLIPLAGPVASRASEVTPEVPAKNLLRTYHLRERKTNHAATTPVTHFSSPKRHPSAKKQLSSGR